MPPPWSAGRTANDARIHISSRVNEVAKPTIAPSRSATQDPPGSVSSRCAVRRDQARECSAVRRAGSSPEPARVRASRS